MKFNADGSGSALTTTRLDSPMGLAFDALGNLYVANFLNDTIRRFSPTGADLGVFASLSAPTYLAVVPDPVLNIQVSGHQAVCSWPVSGTNFTLQSTTNLISPNWTDSTHPLAVHSMRCVVTTPITNEQRFFRLRSP